MVAGYTPGEPDAGFTNGDVIDSPNVNAFVVGRDVEAEDAVEPVAEAESDDLFDPARHTVAEVEAHLSENPDDLERVVLAEIDGLGRKTIVERA